MTVRLCPLIFRRLGRPCFLQRKLFGFDCFLDVQRGVTQQLLYLLGERHIPERFLIRQLLKPGMRVVDVGANIGYYLLMFERGVGPEGFIDAFEPSPENLVELEMNIRRNQLDNVRLFRMALGCSAGKTGLKAGMNSGIVAQGEGQFTTDMGALDDLLEDRVDFVKIDVEGYEMNVLQGAEQTLIRWRPRLFLEFHPHLVQRYNSTFSDVKLFIENIYEHIWYYHVDAGLGSRTLSHYGLRDRVRPFDTPSPEWMEPGRVKGTFWMVCT